MTFLDYLENRLKQPLPGLAAQLSMAPVPAGTRLAGSIRPGTGSGLAAPADARTSAALMHFSGGADLELLFTLRSPQLTTHSGQISFPGGRLEPGEDHQTAALREAEEEVGLAAQHIQVLGGLSPLYIPPSNHLVTPIVGYTRQLPPLRPQASEVAEIFMVPLRRLAQADTLKTGNWETRGGLHNIPYWDVHPTTPLWGATAMMLAEMLALYREYEKGSR